MKRITNYLKLMRVKHYIKNFLIFFPIVFSKNFFNESKFLACIYGFFSFSILSSIIYIINDYRDIEKDKQHPLKKYRPFASGAISKSEGMIIELVLILMLLIINTIIFNYLHSYNFILLELLYFILNLGYSLGLKKIPIVDVSILVSGFVIRILFGGIISEIKISDWLCLTVMSGSFYMGLGKRRNELSIKGKNIRDVLNKYNREYLDKFMNIFLVLSIVFYSLWCISSETISLSKEAIIWTIPIILVIFMQYSLDIENNLSGDPVEILLHDKKLIVLVLILTVFIMGILYI